jgi:hypothetical protein
VKQVAGGFRVHSRRIVVTIVAGLAAVVALSVDDDSRAQVTLTTPRVATPPIGVPSLTIPPVRVQLPSVGVPGTSVQTPPVTIQTPQVTTPQVQVPSVEAPAVSAPSTGAPSVSTPRVPVPSSPAAPRVPDLPDARTPPVSGDGGAGPPPLLPLTGSRGTAAAGGSGSAGAGAPAGASGAGSALAGLGVPNAAALRDASPARRAQLVHLAWDVPLRGAKLRRLRSTLAAYSGCLDDLSPRGRRVLRLRAGAGTADPVSRRVIARRLGVSLRRELRVESRALGHLESAGERGLCGGGTVLGSAGSVRAQELGGIAGAQAGRWSREHPEARRGVLAESERGGDSADGGGPSLGFVDPPGGAPSALLLLALAILGPLGVALLAARTGRASKPPRA